jgi:hypothetical protein
MRQLDKLRQATGCGLDLLVLRRGYGERRGSSITVVAEELYDYIQSGGRDFTKKFNLSAKRLEKHTSEELRQFLEERRKKLQKLKDQADRDLFAKIDLRELSDDEVLTGIIVTPENRHLLE